MRRIRSSSLLALVFMGVLAAPVGAAQASAPSYLSSQPSDGEALHQAPDRVQVTFSEPIDGSSELTVEDSCGRTLDDGDVVIDANTMSVGIRLEPSGHYIASYVAKGLAGGLTGETEGKFHFEVHSGTPCDKNGGRGHKDHDNDRDDEKQGRHGDNKKGRHGGDGGGSGNEDHSSMSDASGSSADSGTTGTDDAGHAAMSGAGGGSGGQGGQHGNKKVEGHGQDEGPGGGHGDLLDLVNHPDGRTQAAGAAAPFGAPNGTAVLLALGLSLGLGVLGGGFLRVSAAR